jgi:hypothetical protein
MQSHTDQDLIARIAVLHATIENWARARDLWFDCGFKTFEEHSDAEPTSPVAVTIMWFEGPLHAVFNGFSLDDGII